jgi:GTP-binding protein EngB required for normal cell division
LDPKQPKRAELVTVTDHPLEVGSQKAPPVEVPILELDLEDKKGIEKWFEMASKITIMVTGETGVGKSTLLNALVGHPVFETGRSKNLKQAVTTHVTEHTCILDDVEIVAIDCPGLHDGTGNEQIYLQEMYDMINAHGGINLLLYCKKMTDRRADAKGDADIITKLTHKLGSQIWQHTLFVLTFANVYEECMQQRHQKQDDTIAQFEHKKREWERHIEETLKKCDINHGECLIKVCAAGFKQPQLCGKPHWLSDFWASAYEIQDENGALALLRLNYSRIVKDTSDESFKQDLHAQPMVLTEKLKKALGIEKIDGETIGAATGAAIGAAIGIALGGAIPVPAAKAGMMIGGATGAAIGSHIGAAILTLYHKRRNKKQN